MIRFAQFRFGKRGGGIPPTTPIVAALACLLLIAVHAYACDNAVSLAVLDRLYPIFAELPTGIDVWISGDYSNNRWPAEFKRWDEKLVSTRAWANKTITDKCVLEAYNSWLDFYADRLHGAESELDTKSIKREQDKYNADRKREDDAKREYQKKHGQIPTPPQ